jgi:hypothetical protein
MTPIEVGKKLVAMCREGKFEEAMRDLYAKNIVSVEAAAPPGGSKEVQGLEACFGKAKHFNDTTEVHSAKVEGPFPNGDRFAVFFDFDVTHKQEKKRGKLVEVGLYTVKDGKITHEEFFYDM